MTRKEWILSLQVAFTYIGTVVGAGFASGQEILNFFTRFAPYSSVGILISALLFGWFGNYLFSLGARYQARSYLDVTMRLYGKKNALLFDLVMTIMLCGVTVAMIAGVGALSHEQIGIPFDLGALFTIAITCLVLYLGVRGLLLANSLIVPFMMTVVGIVFLFHVDSLSTLFSGGKQALFPSLAQLGNSDFRYIWSAISYAAFNLGLSVVVLIPLGGEIRHPKVLSRAAWISSAGLCLLLLMADWVMRQHLPTLFSFEVPMGELSREIGGIFQGLFVLALWAEIFSTLLSNVFGLIRQFPVPPGSARKKWEMLAGMLILLAAYAASHVGFSTIVEHVYPVFGLVGLIMLVLLITRSLMEKKEGI